MEQNLNLYHIFYTTAKAGNISLAAKALYISQPAVSKSISKLEQSLNTTLFYRSSRGVKLTNEGMLLFEQLERAFTAISYGEEQLRKIHELGIGQITIGVSTTLCKYVLLPYLQQFIHDYPHIKVSIACRPTAETLHGLQDGTLDIGLIGESPNMTDLSFLPVMEIQDTFVTTERYLENLATRLGIMQDALYKPIPNNSEAFPANLTDNFTIPQISSEQIRLWNDGTFLMLNEENITRRYIDSYLQQEQIALTQVIEISTMDLLIEFAKIDIGIACVIENFVEKEITSGSLMKLPLDMRIPPRKIGFAWKNKNQTNPTTQFISSITSSIE